MSEQEEQVTPRHLVRDALDVISFPAAAARVLTLLEDHDVPPARIAEAIALDPPLASRVLRMANSPLFLGHAPVDELPRAVMVLGTALLRDLVLGAGTVRAFQASDIPPPVLEKYWKASIACGALAAEIAMLTDRRLAEVAFTAGLIHNLGELVLLICRAEAAREVLTRVSDSRDGASVASAETAVLGFDHTEVGAALAEEWDFPPTLEECMRCHHTPEQASGDLLPLVSIVHIAGSYGHVMDGPAGDDAVPFATAAEAWDHAGLEPSQMPALVERARDRLDAMQAALL